MLTLLIWGGATVALIAAFARDSATPSAKPGFVVVGTKELPVTVTGASFIKAGNQYFDATTFVEISPAEAGRRAAAEGQALP